MELSEENRENNEKEQFWGSGAFKEAQIPVRVFTLAKCHLKKHHQQCAVVVSAFGHDNKNRSNHICCYIAQGTKASTATVTIISIFH